jgi:hypothetical protein
MTRVPNPIPAMLLAGRCRDSCLPAALDYCARDWSVIPIRSSGTTEDRKKPLLASWKEFQTRRATEQEIRTWWTKWPRANVGIVTGRISGIIVLDLDGPNAGRLLSETGIDVANMPCVGTGRGYHYLLPHPGHESPNKAGLVSDHNGSSIDIRGDGGYFIAPPSLHGSGRLYVWLGHE